MYRSVRWGVTTVHHHHATVHLSTIKRVVDGLASQGSRCDLLIKMQLMGTGRGKVHGPLLCLEESTCSGDQTDFVFHWVSVGLRAACCR